MRPPETIAGLPFVEAQTILRRLRFHGFDGDDFRRACGGRRLLKAFREAGLIDPDPHYPKGYRIMRLSRTADQLCAKGIRRISYQTVEALKPKVIAGVKGVALDASIPFEVERLVFFGSAILAEPQPDYGDLDCAMSVVHKRTFPDYRSAYDHLYKTSDRHHLYPLGMVEPMTEVCRLIKLHGGFRSFASIHHLSEVVNNDWPHQVVYERVD